MGHGGEIMTEITVCKICSADANIVGMEEGWIKYKAVRAGIPILNRVDLASCSRSFDVVTAIEALEHVENPLENLKSIRSLMKPGGLFFYTTGNARPFRSRLLKWPYVVPEVHISFFEPEPLAWALSTAGFMPEYKGLLPGFEDIIRFKVLKSLGFRKRSWQECFLPWPFASRIVDQIYQVTAHPIAWEPLS